MIGEVPTRGTDRLQRKLSLDVHWFIPEFVGGYEEPKKMTDIAWDLARRYGFQLTVPRPPAPPPPDTPSWREWFDSLFGFAQTREMLQDEESRGEKEKLIQVEEKEESG